MKKIFATTMLLLMMSTTCAAMTLSTPVEIGSVSTAGDGIELHGATTVNATTGSRANFYVTGTATFGTLYLHFDGDALAQKMSAAKNSNDMIKIYDEVSFFGGRDVKNSVPCFVFEGMTKIFRLPNDAGLELYLLATETGGGGSMTVIGLRGDERVRFFKTNDAKKFYGIGQNFFLMNLSTVGDKIIFSYGDGNGSVRELHYTWDDSTQWFVLNAT